MISLGIISVQENINKNKSFLRTFIDIKEIDNLDFPIIVANVFCKKTYFMKNIFLRNRVVRLLRKYGAQVICLDEKEEKNFCRNLHKNEMNEAVCYALKYIEGEPTGKIAWFSDISGEEMNLKVLYLVSQKMQYLGIRTRNTRKAEMLADELCEEYGVNLDIQDENFFIPSHTSLIVDFDTKKIKIGRDFLIDGRELTFPLHGYHIDIPILLSKCPDFSQKLVHKAWLFGKKRLTR